MTKDIEKKDKKLLPTLKDPHDIAFFPIHANSLEQYIATVKSYPILSELEEQELARAYVDHHDLHAAQQLVLSHLRIVVSVAQNYLGYGLPYGDLIQEGNIGLMKAVQKFDPDYGTRLVSFATHWIRAEIHEYVLKNWRLVKVATTKAQRKLFFNLRSLKNEVSCTPHRIHEISDILKVKPADVSEMEVRLSGGDLSINQPLYDDHEDSPTIADTLIDNGMEPLQLLQMQKLRDLEEHGLEEAIQKLDHRSQQIIRERWLVDKKVTSLRQLGERFHVSAERIRQIEEQAIQKLRHTLSDTHALQEY